MSKNSYLSCLLVLLSISANKGECDDAITFQTDEVDKTHMKLAVSPNGQILATGGYSKQVTLWDVKTQKKIAKLDSLTVPITSLEFSPDGLLLVTGAMDKTLRILSLETKRQVRKLDLPGSCQLSVFIERYKSNIGL